MGVRFPSRVLNGLLAQLEERILAKDEVGGSIPLWATKNMSPALFSECFFYEYCGRLRPYRHMCCDSCKALAKKVKAISGANRPKNRIEFVKKLVEFIKEEKKNAESSKGSDVAL